MIITLNGFPFNDGSNGVWLTSVNGLGMPTVRTSSGNYAGRDGGYIGAQYFSARDITIQGKIFSPNIATVETARAALQAALLGETVTMTVLTNAGNSYIIYANLLDFQMANDQPLFSVPFKIELLATDPNIYEQNSYTTAANLSLQTAGGFDLPVTFPIDFAGGSLPATITNAGTVSVYPIITMTGIATDPVITNNTTEQFLALNLTTASTDEIVINMQQRTVLLNGSSVFGDVTSGSTWWSLLSGGNSVSLSSAQSGDTVTATIQWQSAVMGI